MLPVDVSSVIVHDLLRDNMVRSHPELQTTYWEFPLVMNVYSVVNSAYGYSVITR